MLISTFISFNFVEHTWFLLTFIWWVLNIGAPQTKGTTNHQIHDGGTISFIFGWMRYIILIFSIRILIETSNHFWTTSRACSQTSTKMGISLFKKNGTCKDAVIWKHFGTVMGKLWSVSFACVLETIHYKVFRFGVVAFNFFSQFFCYPISI